MTIEQNSMDAFNIVKEREHIAKYATMYFGRLLQPYLEIIDRLSASEEDIPYMYEHFTYLKGNDKYFREHKIFYRK